MLKNLKIDLLDNINLIVEIAKKGLPSFPKDLSEFISTEFDKKLIILAKEVSENKFEIINEIEAENRRFSKNIEIKNYNTLSLSIETETDQIFDCEINNHSNNYDYLSFLIVTKGISNYLLLFENKFQLSKQEGNNFRSLLSFVQILLKIWSTDEDVKGKDISISSLHFFSSSIKSLIKEIKTNNGLLTLVKEERLSTNVENYFNEIKRQNSKVIKHLNQLFDLFSLEAEGLFKDNDQISLASLIEDCKTSIKNDIPDLFISYEDRINRPIEIDKLVLEGLIVNFSLFISHSSINKKLSIKSEVTDEKQIMLTLSTSLSNSKIENIKGILESSNYFEIISHNNSLHFALAMRYLSLARGRINFREKDGEYSLNISLPIRFYDTLESNENSIEDNSEGKNKVLVIESDDALTSLLRKHLSKWDYLTEIVSSGDQALEKLSKNKYLAVILNIEQENDNSLRLIQSIKSRIENRNTPLIVFSAEPAKDQIYLMGPIEYLVKPINYNNLIEILSSYKLKMDSTVLCVDDDLPTLNLIKQAVNTAGFKPLALNRSETVIEEINDKDIDLAIIDLDMPKVDGFDLIRNIKTMEKFAKLPIIIYTGKEDYQTDLEKVDGMFVDLLEKRSTSIQELENTIIQMINNYEKPSKIVDRENSADGPKILMAEDYKHSQIIVSRLLKKSGFNNIIIVENGEEALNICEIDKIDLILMDMQMPIMNGFEATGKIRELPGYSDTPIIALTAFAMKGDREKCLDAGATDYIPKPIDSKEFIEKIQYYTQNVFSK